MPHIYYDEIMQAPDDPNVLIVPFSNNATDGIAFVKDDLVADIMPHQEYLKLLQVRGQLRHCKQSEYLTSRLFWPNRFCDAIDHDGICEEATIVQLLGAAKDECYWVRAAAFARLVEYPLPVLAPYIQPDDALGQEALTIITLMKSWNREGTHAIREDETRTGHDWVNRQSRDDISYEDIASFLEDMRFDGVIEREKMVWDAAEKAGLCRQRKTCVSNIEGKIHVSVARTDEKHVILRPNGTLSMRYYFSGTQYVRAIIVWQIIEDSFMLRDMHQSGCSARDSMRFLIDEEHLAEQLQQISWGQEMSLQKKKTAIDAIADSEHNHMDSRRVGAVCTDEHDMPIGTGWNGVSRADIGLTCAEVNAEIREDDIMAGCAPHVHGESGDVALDLKRNALRFRSSICAEQKAIIYAWLHSEGHSGDGDAIDTMYTSMSPCHQCYAEIANAGIRYVVAFAGYNDAVSATMREYIAETSPIVVSELSPHSCSAFSTEWLSREEDDAAFISREELQRGAQPSFWRDLTHLRIREREQQMKLSDGGHYVAIMKTMMEQDYRSAYHFFMMYILPLGMHQWKYSHRDFIQYVERQVRDVLCDPVDMIVAVLERLMVTLFEESTRDRVWYEQGDIQRIQHILSSA